MELSPLEQEALQRLNIKKLYVRYFDIAMDATGEKAYPVGEIDFSGTMPALEIVPVIYIKNEVFRSESKWIADSLPIKTWKKITSIATRSGSAPREVQFDCDWTMSTKNSYFAFLTKIRNISGNTCALSATIRLHQVKYRDKMGVPPVDRGMVMVYNMNAPSMDSTCSIYDHKTAMRYLPYLKKYSKECDVAVPIFSWGIHSRYNNITGLLAKYTNQRLLKRSEFVSQGNGYYQVKTAHFESGVYFAKGDVVKIEEVDKERFKEALVTATKYLPNKNYTIALFDLDTNNVQRISLHEIEKVCRTRH